jgi:hypothetical protein
MVFEHIDKLKREYTDKFVLVDENRPELRRFKGLTGTVKTVNMSGRALVEFDGYNNIGWFDIDLNFLRVIDAPLPKEEKPAARSAATSGKEAAAKSPASKQKPKTPAAPDIPKPAPAAAKPGGGMSVADIMTAARSKGAEAPTQPAGSAVQTPAAKDPKQMSVAEMLAAARGQKSGAAMPSRTPSAAETVAADPKQADVTRLLEAARTKKTADVKPTAAAAKSGKIDPSKMSVAEMLAAARGEKTAAAPIAASDKAPEMPSGVIADTNEAAPEPAAPSSHKIATSRAELPKDVTGILAYCRQADQK